MTRHWSHAEKSALWRDPSGLTVTTDRIRSWYRPVAGRHPLDQMQQVYCGDWLTEDLMMKADKMSMAVSLELREPFLDHRLAEWAARLPLSWRVGDSGTGSCSKRVLRAFCSGRIPQSVIDRPKRGFPVPAYGWLAQGLGGWAQALVLGPTARLRDHFDVEAARPVLHRAMRGDRKAAHRIWVLIVLEHWLQAWT